MVQLRATVPQDLVSVVSVSYLSNNKTFSDEIASSFCVRHGQQHLGEPDLHCQPVLPQQLRAQLLAHHPHLHCQQVQHGHLQDQTGLRAVRVDCSTYGSHNSGTMQHRCDDGNMDVEW